MADFHEEIVNEVPGVVIGKKYRIIATETRTISPFTGRIATLIKITDKLYTFRFTKNPKALGKVKREEHSFFLGDFVEINRYAVR